jgi:hypothetical protein
MNHEGRDGLLDIFTSSKVRNRVTKLKQDNDLPNVKSLHSGFRDDTPGFTGAHILRGRF